LWRWLARDSGTEGLGPGSPELITSTRNRTVAAAARLKKRGIREQRRRFLVEGVQAASEALEAGALESVFHTADAGGRVPEVVRAARQRGLPVGEVSPQVMAHLTSTVTPQGLVGEARFVDVPVDRIPVATGIVPVLCSVRDPGNAGTIVRSADAAGAAGAVFTTASVDVYNGKTVRASAGSLFHLPITRELSPEVAVEAFRGASAQVLAAAADGEVDASEADLARPTALLLGNEAWGLNSEVRKLADYSVRIPIRGRTESLNLAAAATLLLFEAARRREGPSGGFGAVVSAQMHDLRLPLTALKGFAATLADRWDRFEGDTRRELVRAMVLDTERVSAMLSLLGDVARLERGRELEGREEVDLHELAGWAAESFARSPDHPSVEVQGRASAHADPERIRSLLLVLCDGTLWWSQEGAVEIELRQGGSGAEVEVRRAGGPGPEEPEAPFDPSGKGTKAALHLARTVVEAIGGSLTADGGDGVSFRLRLPS
jgi:RNA methyltransferase, TrmH family